MKNIIFLAIVALLLSCNNQSKEQESSNESTPQVGTSEVDESRIGRQNFAVIWRWKTTDKQLVSDNAVTITNELMTLWKNDVVENAYYDSDAKIDKFEDFPNISFFIKAKSLEEAETILNRLTVVKKEISEYTIYPVGMKWLGRQSDTIQKKGVTKSYVSVWTTLGLSDKPDADKLLKKQSDTMLDLWNNGIVENVYLDLEGEFAKNDQTDFVFFVNADSKKEAQEILNNLPFAMEEVASYQIFPVGFFWMGEYKE